MKYVNFTVKFYCINYIVCMRMSCYEPDKHYLTREIKLICFSDNHDLTVCETLKSHSSRTFGELSRQGVYNKSCQIRGSIYSETLVVDKNVRTQIVPITRQWNIFNVFIKLPNVNAICQHLYHFLKVACSLFGVCFILLILFFIFYFCSF